ncbi:MAG: serine hydrolase, partial [Anaerolineaceae bacterium]|nr:serine hydrolase [Anaerolineaceae bacterium]
QYNIHSILVIRHGKLVMEAYYPPFSRDNKQLLFSATKSFTSALVGIALGEGKIHSVDDPFLDYFADASVANMSEWKQNIHIHDLLNMTSGLAMCDNYMEDRPNQVQYSLDQPVLFEPGTAFEYNPCNSILLSAIVQKTTGMTSYAYARQKLFKPLGIRDVYWASDRQGVTLGNVGLMLTSRDMAKFGQLYMQNGVWEGRQIVPADWVAATEQINPFYYKYQWWRSDEAIGAIGYAGQIIFVFPQNDLVVVVTSMLPEAIQPAAYEIAYNAYFAIQSDQALPDSPAAKALLKKVYRIAHPAPQKVPPLPALAAKISGKSIHMDNNPLGWQSASLTFKGKQAYLTIHTTGSRKEQKFAIGLDGLYRKTAQKAVTALAVPEPPQRYALNPYEFNFVLGVPVDGYVWMKGEWSAKDTFSLTVQDARDFDREKLDFRFDRPAVEIDWFSFEENTNQITLTGRLR